MIFPNAVYRSIETLKKIGCVVEEDCYPVKFRAIAPSESVERFLLLSREGFLSTFSANERTKKEDLSINFIKDRDSLLEKYVEDVKYAEHEINLIVSGHELPAEVHYENLKAIKRGVKVRAIVQNFGKFNAEEIKNWEEIGVEVRHSASVDIRLVTIDRKMIHLLSYSEQEGLSGLGVKFAYAPFAEMMTQVFEDKWAESQSLLEG